MVASNPALKLILFNLNSVPSLRFNVFCNDVLISLLIISKSLLGFIFVLEKSFVSMSILTSPNFPTIIAELKVRVEGVAILYLG